MRSERLAHLPPLLALFYIHLTWIKIDNDYIVSYVQDWFGKSAKIYQDKKDNKLYANIHGNEQALIYWCLQYGESIELLEPVSTRKKIKGIVDSMRKKYIL